MYPQPTEQVLREMEKFSEKQLHLLFSNLSSVQLTDGCSRGCSYCGLNAKRGIKSYMTPSVVETVATMFPVQLRRGEPIFYFASDPFDYDFDGVSYVHIHEFICDKLGYEPFVATNVPVGKEKVIFDLLFQGMDKSKLEEIKRINDESVQKIHRHYDKNDPYIWSQIEEMNRKDPINLEEMLKVAKIVYEGRISWPRSNVVSRVSIDNRNQSFN